LLAKLQADMKERDEALKKIPPNTEQLIKAMKKEVQSINAKMTKL
jgi:hypothetical protein